MERRKKRMGHVAATLVGIVLVMLVSSAVAQEAVPQLKSAGLAAVLALDPIPGDALAYAGKPVQATINATVGTLSGILFYAGLIGSFQECSGDDCELGPMFAMAVGSLPYFSMLIWDAAGGIGGVIEHNDRLRKKASVFNTLQPVISITSDGGHVGLNFKF
jgi:hypothetical protein